MTRYTINIGDDFPIGDDDEPKQHGGGPGPGNGTDQRRRGPRFGTVLRILFAVSVIAVVVHHAVQVAIITGLILLLRRHPRFQELRSRMRGMAWSGQSWRDMSGCGQRHGRHSHGRDARGENGRSRGDDSRGRDNRGYESFV